jgi:hypothetical protein
MFEEISRLYPRENRHLPDLRTFYFQYLVQVHSTVRYQYTERFVAEVTLCVVQCTVQCTLPGYAV